MACHVPYAKRAYPASGPGMREIAAPARSPLPESRMSRLHPVSFRPRRRPLPPLRRGPVSRVTCVRLPARVTRRRGSRAPIAPARARAGRPRTAPARFPGIFSRKRKQVGAETGTVMACHVLYARRAYPSADPGMRAAAAPARPPLPQSRMSRLPPVSFHPRRRPVPGAARPCFARNARAPARARYAAARFARPIAPARARAGRGARASRPAAASAIPPAVAPSRVVPFPPPPAPRLRRGPVSRVTCVRLPARVTRRRGSRARLRPRARGPGAGRTPPARPPLPQSRTPAAPSRVVPFPPPPVPRCGEALFRA